MRRSSTGTRSRTPFPSLLTNIGTDGRIRNLNASALEASGFESKADVRGRLYWDVFIDPAEREAVQARFDALAPDFPAGEYENTFTNARGEQRVIFWRAAPVRDESGAVTGIVSGGVDITERRKREHQLERERDASTTAFESIPSIMVVLGRDGTIRDRDLDNPRIGANRAFRQALGWRDHELVERAVPRPDRRGRRWARSERPRGSGRRSCIRRDRVRAQVRGRVLSHLRVDGGPGDGHHRSNRRARSRLRRRRHRAQATRGRQGA